MAATYFGSSEGLVPGGLESPLSPDTDGLSPKRTNALSTKLTSVLSSSYTDYEIRDALRILDQRGITNDEDTRRNLKAYAQKEVIDCNAKIVDDFGKVAEQLKRVGAMIATLNQTCASMREHIAAAKQETAPVLEEASTLIGRKKETEMKEKLLQAFTNHFLVSTSDLNILTSSAEPLDERFFTVLARVKQIHRDCEILLGYENQRLGLELMEQTTRNLDAGFKKLYNWIQREFKGLDLEDPHISGSIRRALRVLSERPTLFQNCLDFFAEARETTLAEAFHEALTSSAGAAKAIEFSTHEPLRYVGDMLAWVHSAAVSEKEALEGLFVSDADEISKGLSQGKTSEPWARITRRRSSGVSASTTSEADDDDDDEGGEGKGDVAPVFDGRKALSELISRNLTGVCETLKSRIDVAVRSSGDPVLMFKTFNLLDFYRGIFTKLLGGDSSLSKLVQTLQTSTLAQFEAAMEEETAAATSALDATSTQDLAPPAFLATALTQFSEVSRARGPLLGEDELERLFTAMLRGILTACAESAVQIADPRRRSIYKINYLTALRATLASVAAHAPAGRVPLDRASDEIQAHRDQLVDHVSTTLLEASGVRELMQELDARRYGGNENKDGGAVADDATTSRSKLVSTLDDAAQRLDDFLSSALMDAQDQLQNLLDRTLAKHVVGEAVERFCAEFDELEGLLEMADAESAVLAGDEHENLKDGATGPVGSLRDLYPRTGAEVRALLS